MREALISGAGVCVCVCVRERERERERERGEVRPGRMHKTSYSWLTLIRCTQNSIHSLSYICPSHSHYGTR